MILNDPIIMILKAPIHYVVNLGRQKWILNVFFFGLNNENWRINFQLHWAVTGKRWDGDPSGPESPMDGQPL
jgi:hypothetical protein